MSNKTHHPKTDVYRLYLPKISVARVMNVLVSTYTRKYAKTTKQKLSQTGLKTNLYQ